MGLMFYIRRLFRWVQQMKGRDARCNHLQLKAASAAHLLGLNRTQSRCCFILHCIHSVSWQRHLHLNAAVLCVLFPAGCWSLGSYQHQ